ncbi:MAG: hypothetical protein Kow0029_25940 [Candidatus Rifleibacteriota bacterium]
MKNKIGAFIMVMALLIGGAMGKSLVKHFFSARNESNLTRELEQAAKEINQKCPRQIDEETRLDKAVAGPGKKFSYFYTLSRFNAADIDKSVFDKEVAPDIKKNALAGSGIQTMLKAGITVEYHYSGLDGKKITMVKLLPSELK